MKSRFQHCSHLTQGFSLVPAIMKEMEIDQFMTDALGYAKDHKGDLPSPDTLQQELRIWYHKHSSTVEAADPLSNA